MLLVSFISALSAYSCTWGWSVSTERMQMSRDTGMDAETTNYDLQQWRSQNFPENTYIISQSACEGGLSCTCAEAAVKPAAFAASRKLDPLSSLKVSRTSGFRKPVMPWLHRQKGRSFGARTTKAWQDMLACRQGW